MSARDGGLRERFYAKTERVGDCLVWTAMTDKDGYGCVQVGRKALGTRRKAHAHRIAWRIERGQIPEGLFVLHRCDNPACVEIDHLFLGTHADNMRDRDRKGRTLRGSANGFARLTEAQAREIKVSTEPRRRLAARFGVSKVMVGRIQRGEAWRHV